MIDPDARPVQAPRIQEIADAEGDECERSMFAPCRERDGVRHPDYDALTPREWCVTCQIVYLLAALAAAEAQRAALETAFRAEVSSHRDRRHQGQFDNRCVRCLNQQAILDAERQA